jgi:hypothetical protein
MGAVIAFTSEGLPDAKASMARGGYNRSSKDFGVVVVRRFSGSVEVFDRRSVE